MEMMSKQNKKLSELIKELGDYYISGEINFKVSDVGKVVEKIKKTYQGQGKILEMDGVSFDFVDWRFNVRPSANDPVLRLNLEARNSQLLKEKMEELSGVIGESNDIK